MNDGTPAEVAGAEYGIAVCCCVGAKESKKLLEGGGTCGGWCGGCRDADIVVCGTVFCGYGIRPLETHCCIHAMYSACVAERPSIEYGRGNT